MARSDSEVPGTCERCGLPFPGRAGKRFCSERCREAAEKARWEARKRAAARAARAEQRAARTCLGCGRAEGLDWWVGRLQHPGAASSRCHGCYLQYLRDRYRRAAAARRAAEECS